VGLRAGGAGGRDLGGRCADEGDGEDRRWAEVKGDVGYIM
jgi:hypothetical protein